MKVTNRIFSDCGGAKKIKSECHRSNCTAGVVRVEANLPNDKRFNVMVPIKCKYSRYSDEYLHNYLDNIMRTYMTLTVDL